MSARFVSIDHDTPMLLPPDLRDWGAPDHMVHFVMDAVVALDLGRGLTRTNKRGTGRARRSERPSARSMGMDGEWSNLTCRHTA